MLPSLITLSRAARLVGVRRGTLQKQIQRGELRTFEGELLLADLLHAYPQAEIEDTTMLERVGSIKEQAVNKIIRPTAQRPDPRRTEKPARRNRPAGGRQDAGGGFGYTPGLVLQLHRSG
jgi:hypothetical protein